MIARARARTSNAHARAKNKEDTHVNTHTCTHNCDTHTHTQQTSRHEHGHSDTFQETNVFANFKSTRVHRCISYLDMFIQKLTHCIHGNAPGVVDKDVLHELHGHAMDGSAPHVHERGQAWQGGTNSKLGAVNDGYA
jgi:hypothetical protein